MLPLLMTLAAPKTITMYLGTYTAPGGSQGIYRATLDRDTGAISAPTLAAQAANPSYLALRGDRLYACLETADGGAAAFRVGRGGGLEALNVRNGVGAYACHLAATRERLFVANYGGGSVAALPIGSDGALGEPTIVANAGKGATPRQEAPHLHYVGIRGDHLYACDLGTDEILVYPFAKGKLGPPDRTKLRAGGGPRHLAFSPDGRFAYANAELDNSVTAFAIDLYGALTALQTVSSLPDGYAGKSGSAEIAVHPNGRWLYVSNRGHDSLAVYGIGKDGTLSLTEVQAAGVVEPRGFGIDPSGRWVVVAGQNSDDLVSLPIDPKTGRLGEVKGRAKIAKPVCVVFAP